MQWLTESVSLSQLDCTSDPPHLYSGDQADGAVPKPDGAGLLAEAKERWEP